MAESNWKWRYDKTTKKLIINVFIPTPYSEINFEGISKHSHMVCKSSLERAS